MISVVYFGTPHFSAEILKQLALSKKLKIRAVVTAPDKPVGRAGKITPSAVAQVAQNHGITVLKPESLDQTTNYELRTTNPDLYLVISFGKILPKTLLEVPKYGAVNLHGSLLPKYRGASPIQQSILNGDKTTGATVMLMDEQMDHGPVLLTQKIKIKKDDTFESLSKGMAAISGPLLLKTIEGFCKGTIKPKPQNHAIATYCSKIKKEDGYFDIQNPPLPVTLDRMIRAYYPWPTTWTKWQGRIIKFLPKGLIQQEGKRPTPWKDFLNGCPDFPLRV